MSRSETGAGFTESSKQSCSHQDGEPLGVVPNAVQSVSQDTGDSTADERCFEAGVGPHAVPCRARSRQLDKKRKDYAFRRQFNEKPSIIPCCPVGLQDLA